MTYRTPAKPKVAVDVATWDSLLLRFVVGSMVIALSLYGPIRMCITTEQPEIWGEYFLLIPSGLISLSVSALIFTFTPEIFGWFSKHFMKVWDKKKVVYK